MGLGAYRFSLEWSRDRAGGGRVLDRRARALPARRAACRGHGIVPVVTLHHFTTPRWLAERGGWESPEHADRFARYVARAGGVSRRPRRLGVHDQRAQRRVGDGLLPGGVPAGGQGGLRPLRRCQRGHGARPPPGRRRAARRAAATSPSASRSRWPRSRRTPGGEALRDAAEEMLENVFLRATEGDDFVGVQCYTRMHFGPEGLVGERPERARDADGRRALAPGRRAHRAPGGRGERAARRRHRERHRHRRRHRAHRLPRPRRSRAPTAASDEGIDLRGLLLWSLLDNFEWHLGYGPKFGLVAVAPGTFERRPKPSAHWFGEVARANRVFTGGA